MSSITETRTAVDEIVDNADERELWIVGREFERPPYFHVGKGGDTRLTRALRVCIEGRITPNSDGSYTVEGSEHRTYRVDNSCSCPQSQKAQSKYCYHFVAVCVWIEWQRRLRGSAPVELGTLRAGTLPLPPMTVDERLAREPEGSKERGSKGGTSDSEPSSPHSLTPLLPSPSSDERLAQAASVAMDHVYDALPVPQEDRMPDDDAQYIPEPDDTPVATLAASTSVPALRPRTPQVDDLEAALQVWTTERAVVQRFLKQELKANIDYYTLRIGGKESKPSLSKAGAEKVMGWLKLQASFTPDTGTWEMLGRPTDLVCFVCTIRTRSGEIVGEGRGARSLKKDNGDVNKAIKMAEKSACVSAVLRTGALSDVFTCDLEDMQEEPVKATPGTPAKPTSQDLRQRIWQRVQELEAEATTREAVTRVIMERTGLALHPDHYSDILSALGA